jgi:DNA-binding NtrC family response regulator
MSFSDICPILLVDPDKDWLKFAAQSLEAQGIRTKCATDLSRADRVSRPNCGIQLVLVDVEFTEKSPVEFRHFVQTGNRCVVVLFPTFLAPYKMSRVFKLGAYDCVGKPYDTQSIVRLVNSLIGEIYTPSHVGFFSNCVSVASAG